jgi:hypothetical protein
VPDELERAEPRISFSLLTLLPNVAIPAIVVATGASEIPRPPGPLTGQKGR